MPRWSILSKNSLSSDCLQKKSLPDNTWAEKIFLASFNLLDENQWVVGMIFSRKH